MSLLYYVSARVWLRSFRSRILCFGQINFQFQISFSICLSCIVVAYVAQKRAYSDLVQEENVFSAYSIELEGSVFSAVTTDEG